jgi:tRNA-splicing ligase RtcB
MTASLHQWFAEPLPRDVAAAIDRLARTEDVCHVAVMPDVHLSKDVCTGTVIATRRWIFPQAVGSDIGCGMAAVRFAGSASILEEELPAARLLAGLYRTVPAMRHPRPTLRERLPEPLQEAVLSHPFLEKLKPRDGRVQFATLGRGNHFLEFQTDQEGDLWLMVHSGSRAIGQAVAVHHLGNTYTANSGLGYFEAESPPGRAYFQDLHWACQYAEASRQGMIDAVSLLLEELFCVSADRTSIIHCNHNHVRREEHFGEEFWVHRKGAVSARDGEPGVIPGSMGTASYHVAGRGCPEALFSSSHGAGRRMSRAEAFHAIKEADLERQMAGVWFDHRLAGRLRDEAPAAYKDIHAVMRAQRELTRIVRQVRPLLSYKGG